MQNKSSNNYEHVFKYAVFGALLFGLFPFAVSVSDAHWSLTLFVSLLMCYPLAELICYSVVKIELNQEMILFSAPWRKYSLIKTRSIYSSRVLSQEWDTIIYSIKGEHATFYFFKDNKAVYVFSGNGIPQLEIQLRAIYFPEKKFVRHDKWISIDFMPELFEHYPKRVL